MKLTKETLKRIIKEEMEAVMEYNRELVGGDSSLDRIEGIKTTLSKVNFTSDPDDQFKYKLAKQLGDNQYVMMPDRGRWISLRQRTRWNSFVCCESS